MSTWQVEIGTRAQLGDALGQAVERDLPWLDLERAGPVRTRRLYLLDAALARTQVDLLATRLLGDEVVEEIKVRKVEDGSQRDASLSAVTVCRKPGVMDPVEASVRRGASELGIDLGAFRSGTLYLFEGEVNPDELQKIGANILANPVVDDILCGSTTLTFAATSGAYVFERIDVPLPDRDEDLLKLSQDLGLSLNLAEMQTIKAWFDEAGRDPSDIELETLAQTWSEHCKHKTFAADVRFRGEVIPNLLKSTVFRATKELDRDFCVSVFVDNAGIVEFDDKHNLCFKVETHNHPSAIDPYGGAGTGIGGVIRDILGTGLGGKPVANTNVFCLGYPDADPNKLPAGTIHPLRVLKGVVSGVRDYGNRMGIPTVNGGLFFDERYTGNPLVYAGTVGIIPKDRCLKETKPGDKIVALGGATGRDGIQGATFSSRELHEDSESLDGSAVQIGNAITEKRTMDVLLQARDRGLYRNVTDCGAGGFSSAVGEMGELTGARVDLANAPTKYPGLSYREIWISEAQERMVFAVPPENLEEMLALAASEDVEACVLGEFTDSKRLELMFDGHVIGDMTMEFLHNGLPKTVLEAVWDEPAEEDLADFEPAPFETVLKKLMAHPNVASKEWVIRQYDHEVQSTSCIKSLVGVDLDGPGDAAVHAPVLGSTKGFALGCGMNPHYADLDPYHMATAAIDEALRNVVAVGGDPDRCSILDNFSWGNTAKPDRLGALVRASQGCYDAAMAYRTPFISGKDSLNNEYATSAGTICIPHTLLVSALAIVDDVRQSVTMDLKRAGSSIYLVGLTGDELGGSLAMRVQQRRGNHAPQLDRRTALPTLRALHLAIKTGQVLSCHDLSEGGLAVTAAESAFAGGFGLDLDLGLMPTRGTLDAHTRLFSESLTRFLVEVAPENCAAFEEGFAGLTLTRLGESQETKRLRLRLDQKVLIDCDLDPLHELHRRSLTDILEGNHRG
ncbi:MAG: phosphoribosylformylglycinamidine synthase subunit PurL [Planctomycetota bacterium]